MSNKQIDAIMERIANTYNGNYLSDQTDDAILDHVDVAWKEDGEFNSAYAWYEKHGNGEAEDMMIEYLLDEFEVPEDLVEGVTAALKDKYIFLDY